MAGTGASIIGDKAVIKTLMDMGNVVDRPEIEEGCLKAAMPSQTLEIYLSARLGV